MGKRKRVEEEEEEFSSVQSTSREGTFAHPEVKRVKRERRSSVCDGDQRKAAELPNGHASSSRGLNGSAEPAQGGGRAIWLVRKPINMTFDDLSKIHFSQKSKYQIQRISTSRENEQSAEHQVECQLGRPSGPMMRVRIVNDKKAFDEKDMLRPVSFLRGFVWINEVASQLKNADAALPSEEFLEDDGGSENPIEISSIRKKPRIDESQVKERLKAFGTEPSNRSKKRTEKKK